MVLVVFKEPILLVIHLWNRDEKVCTQFSYPDYFFTHPVSHAGTVAFKESRLHYTDMYMYMSNICTCRSVRTLVRWLSRPEILHVYVVYILEVVFSAVADPGVVPRVPGHYPKFQDDPGFNRPLVWHLSSGTPLQPRKLDSPDYTASRHKNLNCTHPMAKKKYPRTEESPKVKATFPHKNRSWSRKRSPRMDHSYTYMYGCCSLKGLRTLTGGPSR